MKYPALILTAPLAALALAGCASAPPRPNAPTAPGEMLDFYTGEGEAGYHVLMAELALTRDYYATAAREYGIAAGLSDDPDIAARATRVAFEIGEAQIALDSANRWLSLDPSAREPHRFLASLHIRDGDPKAAHPHLKKLLLAFSFDPAESFAPMSALLAQEPDLGAATEALALLVGDHPEIAEGYFALAAMALRAQKMDLALASANRATMLEPDWRQAGMLFARVLVASGSHEEGLERARAVLEGSSDPGLRLEYAILLVVAGDDETASSELKTVLESDPHSPGALRASGLLALRHGNADAAQEHFTALLASGAQTFDAFYFLAQIADQRQLGDRAMRLYSRVQAGDYAVAAQIRVAQILEASNEGERALEHLRQFARSNPQHSVEVVAAEGSLLEAMGRDEDALALYNDVLSVQPDAETLLYARAFLYDSMGRIDEALRELRALVKRRPDDPTALNALGYTLADRTDRLREAHRYIKRALELAPDNPAIIDSMGWVLYRRGEHAAALAHLQRAYSIVPDPEIAAHLGEVLWASGDRDAATALWSEALARDPQSEILDEVMRRYTD